jgi:hypothetical protein
LAQGNAYPCLYCGDVERPRTAEHVLQQAFGTSLVLEDDVCGDCNTRVFSPLDTKLIDFARRHGFWDNAGLPGGRTPIDGRVGVTFDAEAGVWKSIIFNKKIEPIVLPQFVLVDASTFVFSTDARFYDDGHIEKILAELRQPDTLSINTQILPNKTPRMNTALVRSAPRAYLVRASDEGRAAALQGLVESGEFAANVSLKNPPQPGAEFQPRVEMGLAIHLGDMERAVAKVAVNFICKTLGPEIARCDGLRDLREFALRPQVRMQNTRYVSITALREPEAPLTALYGAFSFVGRHTILLLPAGRPHIVLVLLFGRPFAVVNLSLDINEQPLGPERKMAAVVFDYQAKTHRVYSMRDDIAWFGERLSLVRR